MCKENEVNTNEGDQDGKGYYVRCITHQATGRARKITECSEVFKKIRKPKVENKRKIIQEFVINKDTFKYMKNKRSHEGMLNF